MSEQFKEGSIFEEDIILDDGSEIIDDIILDEEGNVEGEIILESDEEDLDEEILFDEEEDPAIGILGKRIHLVMDEGEEMDTVVVSVFTVDNVEWEYIALLPIVEGENEDEGEVLLYRFALDEDGAPILGNIESDPEYEAAAEAFYEELDQYDEEFNDAFGEELDEEE